LELAAMLVACVAKTPELKMRFGGQELSRETRSRYHIMGIKEVGQRWAPSWRIPNETGYHSCMVVCVRDTQFSGLNFTCIHTYGDTIINCMANVTSDAWAS